MSKRSLFAALVLVATALALGVPTTATASAPNGWNPSSDAGFQGLPDRDPTSARFLVLSNANNSTLPGTLNGPGETFLAITFDPAVNGSQARIALFDPNTVGLWDQRVDGRLLTVAPNVRYRLYADPNGDAANRLTDGDNGNDPSLVQQTDAATDYNADPSSDSAWCSFYDASLAATPGALTPVGTYRFLLRMTLEPAPGQLFLQGTERCGHKVAFNGTYLLPADSVIGFGGGAIDERTIVGLERQLILQSFDPVTSLTPDGESFHYNGIFQFNLRGTHACFGDINMSDSDADYQAPTNKGASINDPLQNPTGIPPDNVGFYELPGAEFPLRDVSDFLILDPATPGGAPRPIRWSIFPTNAVHDTGAPSGATTPANPTFTSAANTASGHVSIDSNQQPGVFETALLDQATLLANPGLWCVRWESVDKANFVFMKFTREVGTTPPAPRMEGRVYCDANTNGVYDAGVDGSLGIAINLSVQRVDCNTDAPIGAPIPVVTALDGTWSIAAIQPGCYDVSVVTAIPFAPTGGITLPLRAEVQEDECESGLDIGYDCTQSLCGHVFCDINTNCEYDPLIDEPYAPGAVTVVVQRIDDLGDPVGAPVNVLIASGVDWCATDLPVGRYRVTLSGTDLEVVPGCVESYTVDLDLGTVGSQATANLDFAMVCPPDMVEVCGRVWCDDDGTRTFNPLDDRPIPGMTIEVRPAGQPLAAPIATILTGVDGSWCLDLEIGSYLFTVVYPDPPITNNIEPIGPTSRTVDVDVEPAPPSVDFLFDCLSSLGGRVFCEGPDSDCNEVWDAGIDTPVPGVLVELLLNGVVVDTTLTNAAGLYAFAGLAPGTYTTRVANNAANQALLGDKDGPTPPTRTGVLPQGADRATDITGLDFAYCVRQIMGRVFCEGPESDCDGVYDAGVDKPIPGIVVELVLNGVVIKTDVTDVEGKYGFDQLAPDLQYVVRVADIPANAILLVGKTGPTPPAYNVTPGSSGQTPSLDFAYCERMLAGRVFCEGPDADCDGRYDAGVDTPIPGVIVELVQNGVVLRNTTTNADGRYGFTGLAPGGSYIVRVADNAANAALLAGKAGPDPLLYDVVVPAAGALDNLDFGYCWRRIGGRVFCEGPEADCDGIYQAGIDTPIPGVVVELVEAGAVIATDTTDAQGLYSFFPVKPGVAYVTRVADSPANNALLAGKAGPTPPLWNVTPLPTGERDDLDFAYCLKELSGRVYCEGPTDDCNGVYDDGIDTPIPGVTIELVAGGAVVDTTVTNVQGFYAFTGLTPGVAYTVRPANNAANQALLEDKTGPVPPQYTVTPGTTDPLSGLDFGYCLREISGRVFCEPSTEDCDGIYEPGVDLPIPGILVELVLNGVVVDSTLTNAEGRYVFTGLTLGATYTTRVANNAANAALLADKTGPTPPSYTVVIPASGQEAAALNNLDFAYCSHRELSGTVYCEGPFDDCNGVYDLGVDTPIPGVVVELLVNGAVIATDTTDVNGFYSFDELEVGVAYTTRVADTVANNALLKGKNGPVPPSYTVVPGTQDVLTGLDFGYCLRQISGRVFCEPGEPNCDEVWTPGVDTAIPGILVELVTGGLVVDTTTTDIEGRYVFSGLVLGQSYTTRVAVNAANAALLVNKTGPTPPSWTVVIPALGSLAAQQQMLDFAYCTENEELSGYVYCEGPFEDCNGVYDLGIDTPIPGIVVELVVNGGVVATDTTDANGFYSFDGLQVGVTYTTRVAAIPANDALLEGKNGPVPPSWTVTTGTDDPTTNLNFGYCLRQIAGRVFCEPGEPDCDDVWTPGVDTPIAGIEVELVQNGVVVATDTTDANGRYLFTGLVLGATYTTRVADTVANAALLVSKKGPTPPTWTVVIPASGQEAAGQQDLDFAYCTELNCEQKICIRVYIEPKGKCDQVFTPGVDRWLEGAQVFVKNADDNEGYIAYAYTDADGRACWEGLPPGRYIVYVGGDQAHLGLNECDVWECHVVLRCNEDKECVVGTCERCPRGPACEGEIREVDVELDLCPTEHEGEECLPFEVVLGGFRDGQRYVMDRLDTLACPGEMPIALNGADGVIRVLSMEWTPWGAVRVKLRLTAPGLGSLGSDEMVLQVKLGDDTATGQTAWRAETVRPGAWFTFQRGCTPLPPCEEMFGDLYQWLPLETCGARFLVLDVLTMDSWETCDEPEKPECEPVCLELGVNGPCDWFVDGDARRLEIGLCPVGVHEYMDTVVLVFDGDTWTGEQKSGDGYMTVLSVNKRTDEADTDGCHCWWTISVRLDHPCCLPGRPDCVTAVVKGTLDGVSTNEMVQDVCLVP